MREISRDRDFLDRVGNLAVFDPVPRCAAGIITAYRIDPLSEQFGHHQATAHAFEHRGQIFFTVTDDQIVIATGVGRGSKTELARRVAAEKITLDAPVAHDVARLRRDSFVVERCRRLAALQVWFLPDRDGWRKDLGAQTVD